MLSLFYDRVFWSDSEQQHSTGNRSNPRPKSNPHSHGSSAVTRPISIPMKIKESYRKSDTFSRPDSPHLVNQQEKIDKSDSFLPTTESAYKEVIYFKNWLNGKKIKYRATWE